MNDFCKYMLATLVGTTSAIIITKGAEHTIKKFSKKRSIAELKRDKFEVMKLQAEVQLETYRNMEESLEKELKELSIDMLNHQDKESQYTYDWKTANERDMCIKSSLGNVRTNVKLLEKQIESIELSLKNL